MLVVQCMEGLIAIDHDDKIIMGNSNQAFQTLHRKSDSIGQTEIFEELRKGATIKNDLSVIVCRQPELRPLDESSLMMRRKAIQEV